MRILIVRTACRGVASMAGFYNSQELGLARALSRLGHTCDIVLFGGKEEHVEEVRHDMGDGRTVLTKVYYLKGLALYDTGLFFGLNALAKGYDILQVAEYDQMQSWLLARRRDRCWSRHGAAYLRGPVKRRWRQARCRSRGRKVKWRAEAPLYRPY